MRLPFSKGNEHWGNVRRRLGRSPIRHQADTPLGERKLAIGQSAFLIRSVKSAFALLLTKVTKPHGSRRVSPEKKGGVTVQRTISVMVGKGSVNHNTRKFHAENTDPGRSYLNRSYCNEDMKNIYHELFDEALQRYNEKQTRNDRCIDNYYEKIRSGKQEKLFHEIILQVGNCEDMNAKTENGELAKKVLDEYMQKFQERNPNMRVFSAHLHMDEATPHLHIDFVPFTTGSKRGLDTRVSLKQALAAQGFESGSRRETEWSQWVLSEKQQLASIMERHGIEWEQKGTHQEHLSVLDYKKEQRAGEVKQLEKSLGKLQQKEIDIQSIEKIGAKPIPFSSKVMLNQEEYQTLAMAAKQLVIHEKKERKLEKLLKAAEKTISELRAKIAELTQTLNEFLSIRGKLETGRLQQENKELRQQNGLFKSIIEQNGLSHLLGRQKKQCHKNSHER